MGLLERMVPADRVELTAMVGPVELLARVVPAERIGPGARLVQDP